MKATPSSGALFGPDVRGSDVALGTTAALAVVLGGLLGVASTSGQPTTTEQTPIVREGEVAVAVRPVSESPPSSSPSPAVPGAPSTATPGVGAASLGPSEPLPDGVEPLGPGAPATEVPPRPADAPPPSRGPLPPRPQGGIKALPRIAPPTTSLHGLDSEAPTEPGFGVGGPGVAPGSADPETSPDDPYAYVDPALEKPGASPAQGGLVGGGGEDPAGDEGDPLAARAVVAYRQRLQRWLSSQFVVRGTGLGAAELRKLSVQARIKLDAERTVVDYTIEGKPHPALAAAAREALDDVKGQQAPPLPEHYPGPLQSWVRVTFVCTEDRCD